MNKFESFRRPHRPWVAFAAIDKQAAERLYRAQNLIWIWLGFVAILAAGSYFFRPHWGPVLVTHSEWLDIMRVILFALGGLGISGGIWWIRRQIEICGHILFSAGAILTAIATATISGPQLVSIITIIGLAIASGFRVYFLLSWIDSNDTPTSSRSV